MKSKSKQTKQPPAQKQLNIDLSWQKITDIQTCLRKATSNQIGLPLNHEKIQTLIRFTKQLIRAIQANKSQQTHFKNIQQNYNLIQSKLANHDNIVNNLEQQHMQRLKNLSEQLKNSKDYYQKAKKNLQQSQQQARNQYQEIKKQNTQLKYRVQILKKQRDDLIKTLQEKDQLIKNFEDYKQRFLKQSCSIIEQPPKYQLTPKLSTILCSNLGYTIASYLGPQQLNNLQLLTKQCFVYLTKSKKYQTQKCLNTARLKNRKIAHYHKHIDYFQKLYHKIPDQILQSTFYRYEILKESIGTEIINILNSSAMLFEGKFQDIDDEEFRDRSEESGAEGAGGSRGVVIGGIYVDVEKEIGRLKQFNVQNQANLLEIDEEIIKQFLEDRRNSREKVNKEISIMYSKIKTTAQLYSIDVESIGKFMTNILIHFSKVFVLSKNLYAQARNLQSLNTLILRQLSNWDKIQVQKNSQIEDLKAELQAERKLRIFFTQKGIKSEQRALAQQNIKLGIQQKYLKQTQKLQQTCKQRQQLILKLSQSHKDIKNLKSDNKQIRKAYQNGKQKYNKIIEQLSVVKQIILRMNIV